MRRSHFLFLTTLLFLCISFVLLLKVDFSIIKESDSNAKNLALQHGIHQYTDSLILSLASKEERIYNRSFSSNFEGPKISIEYLSHRNKIWNKEQLPEFIFTPQNIIFDPDWESFGLPNLYIQVTQPRFIKPVRQDDLTTTQFDNLKSHLGFLSETTPVKTYSKTYKNEEGKIVKEQFDLYLTEFQVTIGIKPMRERPSIKPSAEEKDLKRYPTYWYQDYNFAKDKLTSLNDLRNPKEDKNQRYANIECVFKIQPNNQVWYTGNSSKDQTSTSVAIGEIITKQITSNFDLNSGYQQAHIIPSAPGLNLDLFSEATLNYRYKVKKLNQVHLTTTESTIFNRDVYFRIQSNNIGSWDKKGVFFGKEWDDQFTLTFLMPILVKGEFDVLLDTKFKPKYIPQESYYNNVTFRDIIPNWKLKGLGKYISYGFVTFMLLVAIIFVPHLFTLMNAILKRIAYKIKTPPNS